MDVIRSLCIMAIFCAVMVELCPEGEVRKIASMLASTILLLIALGGFGKIDFDVYAREMSRLREQQALVLQGGDELNQRLNRLVIARELETYILDKAEELGLQVREVELELVWSPEGFWVPNAVKLYLPGPSAKAAELAGLIESELGIPEERQHWETDD